MPIKIENVNAELTMSAAELLDLKHELDTLQRVARLLGQRQGFTQTLLSVSSHLEQAHRIIETVAERAKPAEEWNAMAKRVNAANKPEAPAKPPAPATALDYSAPGLDDGERVTRLLTVGGMTFSDISESLELCGFDYTATQRILRAMVREGKVIQNGNTYSLKTDKDDESSNRRTASK